MSDVRGYLEFDGRVLDPTVVHYFWTEEEPPTSGTVRIDDALWTPIGATEDGTHG